MKATGIVRRIDDLGRVVIPKEIRRTMRIREGDPLEIYTDSNGAVIFKKYSPIGEISSFASQYAEVLLKNTSIPVIITDRDHCISAAGVSKKEVLERRISNQLEEICEKRKIYAYKKGDTSKIEPLEGCDIAASCIAPIICAGDICGAVIFVDNDTNFTPDQSDITLLQVAAGFLAKQMEE